jgi:hypothetical protein
MVSKMTSSSYGYDSSESFVGTDMSVSDGTIGQNFTATATDNEQPADVQPVTVQPVKALGELKDLMTVAIEGGATDEDEAMGRAFDKLFDIYYLHGLAAHINNFLISSLELFLLLCTYFLGLGGGTTINQKVRNAIKDIFNKDSGEWNECYIKYLCTHPSFESVCSSQ